MKTSGWLLLLGVWLVLTLGLLWLVQATTGPLPRADWLQEVGECA